MDKGTVLITGGTGLVGKRLTQMLKAKGYSVMYLSRSKRQIEGVEVCHWDVKNGKIAVEALEKADYIIHLAGASVAGSRWTDAYKKEIMESRTRSTQLIRDSLQANKLTPKAFIAASATGFYGDTAGKMVDENAQAGNDFLAEVCIAWEEETKQVTELDIRTVIVRIGVVLSEKGGALPQMAMPVKFFAGAPLGSGKQYVPWIHLDDLCQIFIHAMENMEISGIYNGVAPNSVTNEELTKSIAQALHRPMWPIGVPKILLKGVVGEMSDTVLANTRVSAEKIQKTGFAFDYPKIDPALRNLLQ